MFLVDMIRRRDKRLLYAAANRLRKAQGFRESRACGQQPGLQIAGIPP
jgi:hypothetical protein